MLLACGRGAGRRQESAQHHEASHLLQGFLATWQLPGTLPSLLLALFSLDVWVQHWVVLQFIGSHGIKSFFM